MTYDDDELAARLRAALKAEAAMVDPGDDGLEAIRSRTGQRPWWQHPATLAVAAAVVLGVLVGGAAVLLGGDDGPDVVANQPEQTTSAPGPTTPSATPSTDTPSPSVEDEQAVWVYYVMDNPVSGFRLYREQHVVPGGPPPASSAVQEMFSAPPADPDYSSPWPSGSRISGYQVIGDTATVDLALPKTLAFSLSELAAQQVVYTVTANDTSVTRVQILVDGQKPAGPALDRPLPRAPMVDVQGLIWLLAPTEGETVDSPVRIEGYGTAFEGTVSWEVRRAGSDEVVADGFTQAGANGEFAEFRDTVELEPGDYEIRAFESSAEDGRPLNVDSKSFTVR